MNEIKQYPYASGDVIVLGPECFTDGEVICWKGENFYRQPDTVARTLINEYECIGQMTADGLLVSMAYRPAPSEPFPEFVYRRKEGDK